MCNIGLIPHQAGFDIFDKPFGNVLAGPETRGERIVIEGRVLDGLGAALQGRAAGDLAGQPPPGATTTRPTPQTGKDIDPSFRGWGRTGTDFATGRVPLRDDQARPRHRAATGTSRWRRT